MKHAEIINTEVQKNIKYCVLFKKIKLIMTPFLLNIASQ